MKKKVKLLLTLASLCFSVAVLCFGVYSATTVTYTASGSVSYEVNSVFCKIETTVHSSSATKKGFADATAVTKAANATGEGALTWTKVTDDGTNLVYDTTASNPNADDPPAGTINELDLGTCSLYRITVKVTIYKQSSSIAVTASLATKASPDNLVNTTIVNPDATAMAGLDNIDASAENQVKTLTFYVALTDVTTAASGQFTLSVGVAKVGSTPAA